MARISQRIPDKIPGGILERASRRNASRNPYYGISRAIPLGISKKRIMEKSLKKKWNGSLKKFLKNLRGNFERKP